ncbi:MAG: 30S ribosomal protein S6 [Planctomycetota bacterium]|nr:30S ribosomal protein S6 [Planctomycetota bacterium]
MSSAAQTTKLYEAMFLVDSNKANQDWERVTSNLYSTITRHGGEIANSELWDNERKLAYQIGNYSKATYVLVHFNAEPSKIEHIRHEYELSDHVIRVMILVDEDGISSEIRSLSDEPTDPVRSRSKTRDVNVPTGPEPDVRAPRKPSAPVVAVSSENSSEDSPAEASTESEESSEGVSEESESSEEDAPAESDESTDADGTDADSADAAADEEAAEDAAEEAAEDAAEDAAEEEPAAEERPAEES